MKKMTSATVIRNEEIACDIFSLWLETDLAKGVIPGQFVGVYPNNASTLLPRPISICEVDEKKTAIRLVYRIVGKGTNEMSHLKTGRAVRILGLLGNGYDITRATDKKIALMAGGIGIPPMLELAKRLSGLEEDIPGKRIGQSLDIFLGYRDNDTFLIEELEQYGKVHVATEDGSVGTKGNVMDALEGSGLSTDIICACGPMPMLRAIKKYSEEKGIDAYISLEERMACGVGACLGCVCKTVEKDSHSHVNNARICTDGPVFEAKEVAI